MDDYAYDKFYNLSTSIHHSHLYSLFSNHLSLSYSFYLYPESLLLLLHIYHLSIYYYYSLHSFFYYITTSYLIHFLLSSLIFHTSTFLSLISLFLSPIFSSFSTLHPFLSFTMSESGRHAWRRIYKTIARHALYYLMRSILPIALSLFLSIRFIPKKLPRKPFPLIFLYSFIILIPFRPITLSSNNLSFCSFAVSILLLLSFQSCLLSLLAISFGLICFEGMPSIPFLYYYLLLFLLFTDLFSTFSYISYTLILSLSSFLNHFLLLFFTFGQALLSPLFS